MYVIIQFDNIKIDTTSLYDIDMRITDQSYLQQHFLKISTIETFNQLLYHILNKHF